MSYTHTHTWHIIYIGAQHMSTQHMSTEFISGRSTWVHSVLCDWSILYCSVMHLSFKWFLDRLLRYWLWPARNHMEGNIWSTTCCMYFAPRNIYSHQKYNFSNWSLSSCVCVHLCILCTHTRISMHTYRLWWSFLELRAVASVSSWQSFLWVCIYSLYACM